MTLEEKTAHELVRRRCDQRAYWKLCDFDAMLREEATRQNLVAASTLDHLWARHFVDSVQVVDHVGGIGADPILLDLGSGAGLPGLVLAIIRPDWRVTLIESRRLRIEWLERAAGALGCGNVSVEGRNLTQVRSIKADIITARAFAPMPRLLSLSSRFSTPTTAWVLPKGRTAAQEVTELPIELQGMFHVEQSLSDPDAGVIVGHGQVRVDR